MSAVPPFTFNPPDIAPTSNFGAPSSVSISPVENAMAETKNGVSPSSSMLRFPAEPLQFGTLFRFVKYDYQSQKTNTKFISSMNGASIALPLPMQLQMQLGLNYAGVDTGILGFATKAGAQFAEELKKSYNSNGSSDFAKVGEEILNDAGNTAQYALRKMAANKLLGGASGEAAIDQMLGNVINPFNVATFRNVQSRSYQLSFMLVPTTHRESDDIKKICDAFMYHSLPYKNQGSQPVQGQTFFLNMPDEVEIAYYGTQYLYQFARAAITSVSVDYSPAGPSFFGTSKAPTVVMLNLGIQEIQQLTREAYDSAGYKDPTTAVDEANTSVLNEVFQTPNLGG